jgi:amino acid transporter
MENNKDKSTDSLKSTEKKLSFPELFFISFGGQAPFISLLTFGTVMIAMVGTAGAFAMMIATAVVFFNGIVVYFLSRRYRRSGGYYIYALYGLSGGLGIETGWSYLLYALAYGGTLLAGGAYVLSYVLGISQILTVLLVSLLASTMVIAGIKVSAKYAMVMSTIEMIIIVVLSIIFLHSSGWHFYDPVIYSPYLLVAVIFGLGIPTGYGSIAPLGGDAKDSKAIGRAAITVVIFGGLLATLFFYSLGSLHFTGNLIIYLVTHFGILGIIIVPIIALSDGILGGIAYILANSRTFGAMSEDGRFPKIFSKKYRGKPVFSELLIAAIFVIVLSIMTHFMGLYATFLALGALAGLMNLIIHSSADFSLIKIATRKARTSIKELTAGIVAVTISIFILVDSLPGISLIIQYLFFAWIIIGFLYAETFAIVRETSKDIPPA